MSETESAAKAEKLSWSGENIVSVLIQSPKPIIILSLTMPPQALLLVHVLWHTNSGSVFQRNLNSYGKCQSTNWKQFEKKPTTCPGNFWSGLNIYILKSTLYPWRILWVQQGAFKSTGQARRSEAFRHLSVCDTAGNLKQLLRLLGE